MIISVALYRHLYIQLKLYDMVVIEVIVSKSSYRKLNPLFKIYDGMERDFSNFIHYL